MRIKDMERELARKENALPETAALLTNSGRSVDWSVRLRSFIRNSEPVKRNTSSKQSGVSWSPPDYGEKIDENRSGNNWAVSQR